MKALIIVLTLFVVPALSFSATYYVPDHFAKIQTAIADAGVVNGDVIIVRDGLYHENLDYLGKEIVVKSENGPAAAIIDGGGLKPVVRFASGEGPAAVIEGFTLTNGFGEIVPSHSNFICGGGILCLNASGPLIKDNLIVNNIATNMGGGVAAVGDASGKSYPIIQGNTISNNCATNGYGGAILVRYSDMLVQESIIDANVAHAGGGIYTDEEANISIRDCALFNNAATGGYGGAVNVSYYALSTEIRNCLIYNNSSLQHGGGIYSYGPPITLSNSTFYGNRCATGYGGGICQWGAANTCQIRDSIFWANSAYPGYEQIIFSGSAAQSVTYCDVQGGFTGTGNIDQDPLFTNGPDGCFYLGQTAAGQPVDSPCLDVGSDTAANLSMDALWTRTDNVADSDMVDMGYHYGSFPVSRFLVDKVLLSESTGGAVNFRLLAGPTQANKQYLIVAGVTGTYPGIPLPGWPALPVNWDPFTTMVIGLMNTPVFQNFLGQLDANGEATAKWDTMGPLPSGSAGIAMYFAYATEGWKFVSNATKVYIVP